MIGHIGYLVDLCWMNWINALSSRYSSVMESQVNASPAGISPMSGLDYGCIEAANVHDSSPFLRM